MHNQLQDSVDAAVTSPTLFPFALCVVVLHDCSNQEQMGAKAARCLLENIAAHVAPLRPHSLFSH